MKKKIQAFFIDEREREGKLRHKINDLFFSFMRIFLLLFFGFLKKKEVRKTRKYLIIFCFSFTIHVIVKMIFLQHNYFGL